LKQLFQSAFSVAEEIWEMPAAPTTTFKSKALAIGLLTATVLALYPVVIAPVVASGSGAVQVRVTWCSQDALANTSTG
jgi:hypothetical protein